MANSINKKLRFLFIGWLVAGLAILGLLAGLNANLIWPKDKLSSPAEWLNLPTEISGKVRAIVVPHHLLVKSFMQKFYSQLAANGAEYQRIVIISPNHFNYGLYAVRSVLELKGKSPQGEAFEFNIDQDAVQKLADQGAVRLENRYFEREHGVFVQAGFIKEFWPEAKVVPIIIKNGAALERLNKLIEGLRELDDGKTLFLFSVDFSHYTSEEFAVLNDLRTLNWLSELGSQNWDDQGELDLLVKNGKSFDVKSSDSVAVDSPESLWVMGKMADLGGWEFNLWGRTSSASIADMNDPTQNTSHIFGWMNAGDE
ncbi:AmmeMemoRadiSam system protein B [Candidatus Peregrinibacteria bacterium]|nr:AmmeMemoRadiSam system protein B [Candidatus Peregrinibacteria bacterium]